MESVIFKFPSFLSTFALPQCPKSWVSDFIHGNWESFNEDDVILSKALEKLINEVEAESFWLAAVSKAKKEFLNSSY